MCTPSNELDFEAGLAELGRELAAFTVSVRREKHAEWCWCFRLVLHRRARSVAVLQVLLALHRQLEVIGMPLDPLGSFLVAGNHDPGEVAEEVRRVRLDYFPRLDPGPF
jgi:hypothetical protein